MSKESTVHQKRMGQQERAKGILDDSRRLRRFMIKAISELPETELEKFKDTQPWLRNKLETISDLDFTKCFIGARVCCYATILDIRQREQEKQATEEEMVIAFMWPIIHV